MAKAYLLKSTEDTEIGYKRDSCGCTVEEKTAYRTSDDDLIGEDNYNHYWTTTGEQMPVWWDENCEVLVTEVDEVRRTGGPVWCCGVCEAQFYDDEDAVECCQ